MSLRRAALALALCSLLGGAVASGCGSPSRKTDAPKRQVILITEYDDRRAGAETAVDVEAAMGLLTDIPLADYVRAIGKRLVAHASQRPFEYRFLIVDQPNPNAFALPGGHIYVSRGLLALTNSEDELACVLAHEIIHAAERHAARNQAQARRMNPLAMGIVRAALIAENSRESERDADRGAQLLCGKAGYDPMALAHFLRDMDAVTRLTLGWSRLPNFLATHPTSIERAAEATARAQSRIWSPRPGISEGREDHLRRLDGLVLGPNPSEGLFVGSRFLHPDLGFQVRFPDGWTFVNTHRAVGAISPQRDAQSVLTLDGRGDDPAAAAKKFLEGEAVEIRAKITRSQPLLVGELPAYRVEGSAPSPAGSIKGQITWIAYGGLVYRITAASPSRVAEQFVGRARAAARSFRPMTPEERESIRVMRLRVVRAKQGERLAELIARHRGDTSDIAATAAMNDLGIDTVLAEGTLVKLSVSEPYTGRVPSEPAASGTREP